MKIVVEMESDEFMEFMEFRKDRAIFRNKETCILRDMGGKLENLANKVFSAVVGDERHDDADALRRYKIKDQESARELMTAAAEVFS